MTDDDNNPFLGMEGWAAQDNPKHEPLITVNGKTLTVGQAMTVRVAVCDLIIRMTDEHALGKDKHGEDMRRAYLSRATEVVLFMNQNRESANDRAYQRRG